MEKIKSINFDSINFSFVVPIYNTEKYIEKCVNSLLLQTYQNIEIILVDDGSTDLSPNMCDEFAKKDNRVKAIHKINGGLSDARNFGISFATGDYVVFVDSDDYIELDFCEKLVKYASQGVDVIVCSGQSEGAHISLKHFISEGVLTGQEYLLYALDKGVCPMAAWLYIYSREFLQKNNLKFKYGILHEDEEFTPRALLEAKSVLATDLFFYHYMIRENSITTKKDKRKNVEDLYNSVCELETLYNNLNNEKLRELLLDSLVEKYLSIFQIGKIYQYGKKYIHKDFVKRNSKKTKTKLKSNLFCFSVRLYYFVNSIGKKIFR